MGLKCKFKYEKFDKDNLEVFQEKLNCFSGSNLNIMLFSLSGFTDYVVKNTKGYVLVTLADMYL